jgi:hypothetical protein
MGRFATQLAEWKTGPHVNGGTGLQVGQPEIYAAISAVCGTQEGKECLILIDGQQLSVTKSPSLRREIETDDFDFR